ncbi:MAG: MaoC family dehydratase [Ilumatobacter sp.]|nr:MaoC family dehydratase [Ilumatobacter sp.]
MRYFEDLEAGAVYELGTVEVDEDEVIDFATRFDPQPFHIDPVAAAESHFGGIVASGWHTCAMFMRLFVDNFTKDTASMGSPGMEELRWLAPVRPGDRLTATFEIVSTRPSASKPDRGLVASQWKMTNQDGVVVMTLRGTGIYARRPT